jgi:hypothetical protein
MSDVIPRHRIYWMEDFIIAICKQNPIANQNNDYFQHCQDYLLRIAFVFLIIQIHILNFRVYQNLCQLIPNDTAKKAGCLF